jgi:hypothetical protein
VCVVAAVAFAAGRRSGDFDRHPWTQFGIGAQATFRVVQTTRIQGTEHRTTATVTQRYVGDETLRVGGREVRCVVIETVSEDDLGRSVSRMWQSADVPGFIVKTEITHPQMTSVQECTEFRAGP